MSPDGSQVLAGTVGRILVYSAGNGQLQQSLKGHKDSVYTVTYAKQGKRFASGGQDRQVIIWSSQGEGLLKYAHENSVYCLSYNPVTQVLASGSLNDLGLWSPEQKNVTKVKIPSKCLCIAWTADGGTLVTGHLNGGVSIRGKDGVEKMNISISTVPAPVIGLCFPAAVAGSSPGVVIAANADGAVAAVKTGTGTVSNFRLLDGDKIPTPSTTEFTTLTSSGALLFLGSTGPTHVLDIHSLARVADVPSPATGAGDDGPWTWSVAARSSLSESGSTGFVRATDCGKLSFFTCTLATVHALHRDWYACRASHALTRVVIRQFGRRAGPDATQATPTPTATATAAAIATATVECGEVVKKVALAGSGRLAVLKAGGDVAVFAPAGGAAAGGAAAGYELVRAIPRPGHGAGAGAASLLVLTEQHVALCGEKKIEALALNEAGTGAGTASTFFTFASNVRYIKPVSGREALLVCLKGGEIHLVFLGSASSGASGPGGSGGSGGGGPVQLHKHSLGVRCADLSVYKDKLAFIDDAGTLHVVDLDKGGEGKLFTAPNCASLAFNQSFNELLVFSTHSELQLLCLAPVRGASDSSARSSASASSGGVGSALSISGIPGFVVGFSGPHLHMLQNGEIVASELPVSELLNAALREKSSPPDFSLAYKAACLGATGEDWRKLGRAALEALELEVAEKAFSRVFDRKLLDIVHRLKALRSASGEAGADGRVLRGYMHAFFGDFKKAGEVLLAAGRADLASAVFADMRLWAEAKAAASAAASAAGASGAAASAAASTSASAPSALALKQARASAQDGELATAAELYFAANQLQAASELYMQLELPEPLVEVARRTESGSELRKTICTYLAKHGRFEALSELQSGEELVELLVKAGRFPAALDAAAASGEIRLLRLVNKQFGEQLVTQGRYLEGVQRLLGGGEEGRAKELAGRCVRACVAVEDFSGAGVFAGLFPGVDCETLLDFRATQVVLHEAAFTTARVTLGAGIWLLRRLVSGSLQCDQLALHPDALTRLLVTTGRAAAALGAHAFACECWASEAGKLGPEFLRSFELSTDAVAGAGINLAPVCPRCEAQAGDMLASTCAVCGYVYVFSIVDFLPLPVLRFSLEGGVAEVAKAKELLGGFLGGPDSPGTGESEDPLKTHLLETAGTRNAPVQAVSLRVLAKTVRPDLILCPAVQHEGEEGSGFFHYVMLEGVFIEACEFCGGLAELGALEAAKYNAARPGCPACGRG